MKYTILHYNPLNSILLLCTVQSCKNALFLLLTWGPRARGKVGQNIKRFPSSIACKWGGGGWWSLIIDYIYWIAIYCILLYVTFLHYTWFHYTPLGFITLHFSSLLGDSLQYNMSSRALLCHIKHIFPQSTCNLLFFKDSNKELGRNRNLSG